MQRGNKALALSVALNACDIMSEEGSGKEVGTQPTIGDVGDVRHPQTRVDERLDLSSCIDLFASDPYFDRNFLF
jgi:hypothetical protein